MPIFKSLERSSGLRISAYGGTAVYKSCLYPLKRRILIFKSLKRGSGLRTGRTGVRLFVKVTYTR